MCSTTMENADNIAIGFIVPTGTSMAWISKSCFYVGKIKKKLRGEQSTGAKVEYFDHLKTFQQTKIYIYYMLNAIIIFIQCITPQVTFRT